MMSSVVMTKTFGTNLTNDQNVSQSSAQLSEREKSQIIERLIAILSENRLKPWVSVGLKDEYQKRHNYRLPDDWLTIIEECGRDQIEIETLRVSNGTKILIQLPIRSAKKSLGAMANPVLSPKTPELKPERMQVNPIHVNPMQVTPKPEELKEELLIDIMSEQFNSVPNQTENRPLLNYGAGDQTKSGSKQQSAPNIVNHVNEVSNGGVEDVIFGGLPIPPPVLPQIKPLPINPEDFFDVVVVLAATPSNFIVVPFKNATDGSEFYDLKYKMCELYEKEENKIELPPEFIKKGLFVAAKAKNMWYRVEVMSVLSDDPFQMIGYLCDFGEHKAFSLENIQPLYNCFRDLPMQAIRATLATVEPNGNDWDVITSIEFRKMVENKPFVATVYGMKVVDNNPVLMVSLCDTSSADDLYVGPTLCQRSLAKPVVTSI